MMNNPAAEAGLDLRLRTMRILWALFLITIGLFVLVTRFARPDDETRAEIERGDPTLLIVLAVIGLSTVVASFVLKAGFYRRAAEQQRPELLQSGFIVAMVFCEVAVLLGLVGLFITWNDYAYLLFALGALGEALHFPRREQAQAAYNRRVG